MCLRLATQPGPYSFQCRQNDRGGRSTFHEPDQHTTDMILTAEKHAKDADDFPALVDFKPVHRAAERQMPETGQDVVVTLASERRDQDTVRSRADFQNSRCGVLDSGVRPFAEVDIAFEQMVENQIEIALGCS